MLFESRDRMVFPLNSMIVSLVFVVEVTVKRYNFRRRLLLCRWRTNCRTDGQHGRTTIVTGSKGSQWHQAASVVRQLSQNVKYQTDDDLKACSIILCEKSAAPSQAKTYFILTLMCGPMNKRDVRCVTK